MPSDARQKMIESAVTLLAMRGLEGTAFSDVLERSGAPRGSIYHHFPDGKDQLVEAAIELAGERALGVLDGLHGSPPKAVTEAFFDLWRAVLVRSNVRAGCAVLAVTVATDSPDLRDQAASIFRAWRGLIAELFVEGGMAGDAAATARRDAGGGQRRRRGGQSRGAKPGAIRAGRRGAARDDP